MKFTDIFIRRPVLAASISVLILILGLQALLNLPVRQFPETTNTQITISTSYHGAAPELIRGFVTQPIQQAVSEVEDVDFIESSSSRGLSRVTLTMKLGADPDAALTSALAQVNSVRSKLPREVQDPVISRSTGSTTAVMYLTFRSDTLDAPQITDYVNRVMQPQLNIIDGVSQAEVYGAPLALRIWLDPVRLATHQLTPQDVNAALQANSTRAAPGQAKSLNFQFNVSAQTDLADVEEFANLVLAQRQGNVIKLRDVAKVELSEGRITTRMVSDGENAVVVAIQATPTANPLVIADQINAMVPDLERMLPDTINMKVMFDSSVPIKAAINEVINTLFEAVVVVILIIFLFLGSLRAVTIPLITIPLSLIGVCLVMQMLGFSINLITLLAMVLAIGLVVDDAIVVVENVDRHLRNGETPFRAAIRGSREIIVPVIATTLCMVAVFAPIALLGGLTGALFKEFALTLAGAVVVSSIVALTLSPMMCAKLLRPQQGQFALWLEKQLGRMDNRYSRMLEAVMQRRALLLGFALVLFASLPFIFRVIPGELAPYEDQDLIVGIARAPNSATLDWINANMEAQTEIVQRQPENHATMAITGVPNPNQGLMILPLTPASAREASQAEVIARITPQLSDFPAVSTSLFQPPPLPGVGGGLPFQFVISSTRDHAQILTYMEQFQREAQKKGLFIFNNIDLKYDMPSMDIRIDRDKAGSYGVSMQDIADTLSTLMGPGYVNRVNIDGRSYEVIPQAIRADRQTAESVGNYYVRSSSGMPIKLADLIEFDLSGQPRALSQFNQQNSVILAGVLMPGVAMGEAVSFFEALADEHLPRGYGYDFKGEARQFVQEGSELYWTFALAMVVIFLVLASQYESLRDPLVILTTVPLALFGSLWIMGFGLATMNIYTQIGLLTLAGLVSKNGILICEVAKTNQLEHGMDRISAVVAAARLRLRAVLMTTISMVVGLMPLLMATGNGANSRFGIGLVIVTGLSIGTLFTLFILPVIYSYLASKHKPLPVFEEACQVR